MERASRRASRPAGGWKIGIHSAPSMRGCPPTHRQSLSWILYCENCSSRSPSTISLRARHNTSASSPTACTTQRRNRSCSPHPALRDWLTRASVLEQICRPTLSGLARHEGQHQSTDAVSPLSQRVRHISYPQWRTRTRLFTATVLLSRGETVTRTAHATGWGGPARSWTRSPARWEPRQFLSALMIGYAESFRWSAALGRLARRPGRGRRCARRRAATAPARARARPPRDRARGSAAARRCGARPTRRTTLRCRHR